jgi:phosphoglycolate phosphatase-like HAD superfamily hydrolase
VKFRYFFEEIRNEQITEDQVNAFASKFSEIMLSLLLDEKLLIQDSLNFVKANHAQIPMHIVSGSDQTELRKICQHLEIDQYFRSIHGSPTPKKQLVKEVLENNNYPTSDTVLIGDAINDFDAAQVNEIAFAGYNNINLKGLGEYIDQFS